MEVYRKQLIVPDDGTLTLQGLPFRAGDRVEIVVRSCTPRKASGRTYALRGKPFRYIAPFEGVAEEDWEALQ